MIHTVIDVIYGYARKAGWFRISGLDISSASVSATAIDAASE
jgi:hypothetical protein